MSMFDNDSYNDGVNAGKRIAIGCMVASLTVLAILLLTFSANKKPKRNNINQSTLATVSATDVKKHEAKAEYVPDEEKRTSDELSFWNMYDENEEEKTVISADKTEKSDLRKKKEELLNELKKEAESENEAKIDTKNKFNLKTADEEPEYVAVNKALSANELNDDNFYKDDDGSIYYQVNGRTTSHFGIDVSKNNGDIDWKKVREDGVEFAMLKIGSRGYSTGKIILDENFQKNCDGCSANGIDVGAYFFSQAVTKEEAFEEANYCVAALGGRKIAYPVVFDTEAVANDSYRTENVSASTLTECAVTFCDVIRAYGYIPMVAGTKEQLVRRLDLNRLYSYGFWLFDTGELSDYPYRYAMRQYSNEGSVSGINGNVSYDICFISYAER